MIEQLGFPGYFLIVWDIVEFCRRNDIYCQGRGSAANSAVCYALGITNADAVTLGLLFERFLSRARDGPPDIDLDIENGPPRRGDPVRLPTLRPRQRRAGRQRHHLPPKSAVRDMGKALGFPMGTLDAWSKQVDGWGPLSATVDHDIPAPVMALAAELQHFPRHLGIHSGGMVICDRPVVEVCPVEWGRMEGRSVLQWDKDDCAAAGLVKFDLLGLGMLTVLHYGVDLIREHHGVDVDLATLPQEPGGLRHAVPGRLGRACSRWRAGPRWPRCPASSPARSTTWSSRWRSSGPGPSRAGRCTPTSAAATGRRRSPTCTRCSSPR